MNPEEGPVLEGNCVFYYGQWPRYGCASGGHFAMSDAKQAIDVPETDGTEHWKTIGALKAQLQ